MTSTVLLSSRRDMNFIPPVENSVYGGMENHYIKPWGECHPDYEAIPVNKKSGVKICVRKISHDPPQIKIYPSGNYTNSKGLYEPGNHETRISNDLPPGKRTSPNEEYLYQRGYFRVHNRYNGTGIENRPVNQYFGKPIYCVELGRNRPPGSPL